MHYALKGFWLEIWHVIFKQRYVRELLKPYVYDLSILILLLIPRTWYLKKTMEMLLLWNVMQTMNFSMMYKYEMF